ncbi:protein CLEC16A-like isoform X3 [Apostichopus japonicus]|uniref:protein CLEC16A-like isoform X3 n=1 Tax=Stichopus japonicus TaxID=307972 RepID=UPI003AB8BC67
MFSKSKSMWGSGGKTKNLHSLEQLRHLHGVLMRNAVITEQNSSLLVETLRSISEILIWGDQNDSSVFDFFLEKNMLLFFLKILRQKTGKYICVQLLQTLNILFENIRNETSLYYLLSNNHVNSIIVHKFDFSDEEVLAYYISFLKTLSFKLNVHTIHFFYNEHTNDFALYTEAIKFFNHSESMVRIAVRTLTLNVYKVLYKCSSVHLAVQDNAMLTYIRNKTAVPYFSNLVWFIGNNVLNLNTAVKHDVDHRSKNRLETLIAEHLDHLHYVNDILSIDNEYLNDVLTEHMLNRLLVPLYVDSLTRKRAYGLAEDHPHICQILSLFLLSQVFLIMMHPPLVSTLAKIIFEGSEETLAQLPIDTSGITNMSFVAFVAPSESLESSLDSSKERDIKTQRKRPNYRNIDSPTELDTPVEAEEVSVGQRSEEATKEEEQAVDVRGAEATAEGHPPEPSPKPEEGPPEAGTSSAIVSNSTDEEKSLAASRKCSEQLNNRPYLAAILNALDCTSGDYKALLTLCLLHAMSFNQGIPQKLFESVSLTFRSQNKSGYNTVLAERLIALMNQGCQPNSLIRPVTLDIVCRLVKVLVFSANGTCYLEDRHLACIEGAKEESVLLLRNYYKGDELFLDMFDDEYQTMKRKPLNVEYLMMDECLVLRPTGTPLTGIDFIKRLPSGEIERTRRAIRAFFQLRDLSMTLRKEVEGKLPLTKDSQLVSLNDKLDLNNSDLIGCTVITKDKSPQRVRRFLVISTHQLVLVEPDNRKLGWGVARFVGLLQDLEVTGDKDDSRSLHVTIHKRSMVSPHAKSTPILNARFQFDDHIRCMAAKQRLTKGRQKTRQAQMMAISDLLEIPHSSGNYGTAALSAHPGMAMPVRQNVAKRSSSGATDAATRQSRERSTSSPMSSRRQPGSHRNQDERRHSAGKQ